MAIFNSYVKLPEGIPPCPNHHCHLPSAPPPFSHEISTISGTFLALYCTVWPRPTETFKAWNFNGWPSPPTHPRHWNLSAHRGSKAHPRPVAALIGSDMGHVTPENVHHPTGKRETQQVSLKNTFYILLPCGGFLKWNPSDHASHRCLLGNQGYD